MAYQVVGEFVEVEVLAVLADPTRRTLLELLRGKTLAVGELAERMPVSRPAVSQHLKVLKEAQLVTEQRLGTRHTFSLNPVGFAGLREYAEGMWRDALGSFAAYVAEQKAVQVEEPKGAAANARGGQREKRISKGNDSKKGKGNGEGKSEALRSRGQR